MKALSLNDTWELYCNLVLTKKSQRAETSRWNNHIRSFIGGKNPCEVTQLDCLQLKKILEEKGLSKQSIHHCLSLIRRVVRRSIEWGYSKCDPIDFSKIMPKFDNQRARFLSREDSQRLLDALDNIDTEWHDIVLFDLNTGLRRGELFSIQKSHIDFSCNFLYVVDTKTDKNRVVPLNNIAINILKRRGNRLYPFEDKSPRIFTRAVNSCGFNDEIKDRRQRVVFHTLRHTFASWLAIEGTPLTVISKLLGHSTIDLTMRYAHLTYDQEKQATGMLEKLFTL